MRSRPSFAAVAAAAVIVFSASLCFAADAGRLVYKILLPMEIGEQAKIIWPNGDEREIGRVLGFPTESRYPGFTASKHGGGAQIIASAANAHHIQIDVEEGAGRTVSIIPMRTYVAASGGMDTSFIIEGEGGLGLWGEWSPYVGNPVYAINAAGIPVPFNDPRLLEHAKAVEIRVFAPDDGIEYFEIENRLQGRAWYHTPYGDHDFAVVLQPVKSTGRFEGTVFEGRGMVRANHPGVVCISTSDRGHVGGFQIVPRNHTFSAELQKTRRMSQYIVLRGVEWEDLTGQPPFFRGTVRPGDESDPSRTTGRVFCLIDGAWSELPEANGISEHSMEKIEAFRIYSAEADLSDMGEIQRSKPQDVPEYVRQTEVYVPGGDGDPGPFDAVAAIDALRRDIAIAE